MSRSHCKLFLITLLVCGGYAQESTFRTTVPLVLVPATVMDSHGRPIDGLLPEEFLLLDNNRPQTIHLDTADTALIPIAFAAVIQADDVALPAILKIRKVGSMIEPLITGERGQAAILSFGQTVKLVQDFTADPQEISQAFRTLKCDSGRAAHMIDAVAEAVHRLGQRPSTERRVLLIIGESRDRGSETKLAAAVQLAQRAGVLVYAITYSAYVTPFTTKADELPPPQGGPDILAAITEVGRLGKTTTTDALTRSTGGRRWTFAKLRGLEQAMAQMGEELHSQYLLSYPVPAGTESHQIEVKLPQHPKAVVRARLRYWP